MAAPRPRRRACRARPGVGVKLGGRFSRNTLTFLACASVHAKAHHGVLPTRRSSPVNSKSRLPANKMMRSSGRVGSLWKVRGSSWKLKLVCLGQGRFVVDYGLRKMLEHAATIAAFVGRWSGLLSVAAARSFAASLLSLPISNTANVDGE